MFDRKEIADRLKAAREALPNPVNATQFAKRAKGVDGSQYSKFEKGGPMGNKKIMELCSVWGINVDWVYRGEGGMFVEEDASTNLPQKQKPGIDNRAFEENHSITDVMISLGTILQKVDRVLIEQTIARAEVRAYGQYQVSKDAHGDQAAILKIMEQIGKLIDANLADGVGENKLPAYGK